MRSAVVVMMLVGGVAHAKPKAASHRYSDARVTFDIPDGMTATTTTDVSAEHAVALTGGQGGVSIAVLIGEKNARPGDVETLFDTWHSARIKNRVAWGMRSDGGPPRETVHVGDRRFLRQRDRIGGRLLSSEQTMTCGVISAHFICTLTSAPIGARDIADGHAAKILSSLDPKR